VATREGYIGVGIVGALMGALVAASVQTEPSSLVSPGELAAPSRGESDLPVQAADVLDNASAGLMPLVLSLQGAHADLHGRPATERSVSELPTALADAVSADSWFPDLRAEFHRRAGPGVFVDQRGLTPFSEALLIWLGDLEDQGLSPEAYGVDTLSKRVEDARETWAEARANGPKIIQEALLLALLKAPTFDQKDAIGRLAEVSERPGVEDVEAAKKLLDGGARRTLSTRAAQIEAALGRALLRSALDFRILKRTGPFKVSAPVGKMEERPKWRKRILKVMLELLEAPEAGRALADLLPPHPSYAALVEARMFYAERSKTADCPSLHESWKIKPGTEGSEVKVLQERLACEGLYEGPINGRYGDLTLGAVKSYQEHHELDADGYVFTGTIKSMNVPLSRRLAQIDLALRRVREYAYRDLGDPYIRVNVPLYEIQVVEAGKVTRRHRAIVGSNRLDDNKVKLLQGHINRTEIFRTRLYEAIVHPDWILPLRVERGEVKAKLAEDPSYLKKANIIEQTLPSGKKVLIQRSGEGNVLGKVKFLLERSRAIFVHDTNKPELFEKKRRDFSHGCMRIDRALDFANWVLVQDGWDPKEVRRSLLSDKTQRGMGLKKPLDLITEYMTVDVAHDGKPIFLTDIYGYDKDFLQGDLPPTVTMLWGSSPMRPHWVPRVPEEVVLKWKAAGKEAPHNYDPTKDP
jgi:hypothetical protein